MSGGLPACFWRISNHADLLGRGGPYGGGRWHMRGQRVVYLAESPPGALLEILVHLELPEGQPPKGYQLLKVERVAQGRRPGWDDLDAVDGQNTQDVGQNWLVARKSVLARVPSAIMPRTFNWLFNPMHPQAGAFGITESIASPYDPRLLRG